MNNTYSFRHHGRISGPAFTLDGLDGLRAKVRNLDATSGISCGAVDIEHLTAAPIYDESLVHPADYTSPGWYLCYFSSEAVRYDDEADALVAFIEDRTETRFG